MAKGHANTICGQCPNPMPCPDHPRGAWSQQSPRNQQRADISPALRRKVMERWGRICHVCDRPGADEVDHVIPVSEGGRHHPSNMRPIHAEPCHRVKTAAEAARARANAKLAAL